MKKMEMRLCISVVLSVLIAISSFTAYAQSMATKIPVAQGPVQQINEYFSTQATTYSDGTVFIRNIINGPPTPPPGYALERSMVLLPEPSSEMGTNTLTVPAFKWVFGCSSVSGAMIAGYYDLNGFPIIYTGPTAGGVIPLDDSYWSQWTDSAGAAYPNNPLIASHNGLDGRTTPGSIDDYWIKYGSNSADPYIAGGWTQHTWGDAIGDYMKTSQSAYGNSDGATTFWSYSSANRLTCSAMETSSQDIDRTDGSYGRKLFYEARGYTVTDCYNQRTDNKVTGGFSFAQYKAEIDAGHPVFLNLAGHSIVGVGYNDPSTVYLHDTWDWSNHTMPWGGSYAGLELQSVSIVNLQAPTPNTPDISVSPSSYDFGNVNVSNTSTTTFTISNAGTGALSIGTITIAGDGFGLGGGTCSGQTIAPSSSCNFQVMFSPLSEGTKSASVSIPSNDSDESPLYIPLSGTGVLSKLDLSGTWSNVSRTGPRKGVYTVSGTFTTANAGSQNASNVVVNFYLSNVLVKTYKYKSIAAGSSKATTIRFTTPSLPRGKSLIAVIDPSNNITESNETNNIVSTIIP